MSAIPRPARSARFLTQRGDAEDRSGAGGSTRRLPPPPLPQDRPPRGNTRRLPPPPLPMRQRHEEESSDVALLDCAPGTKLAELARFTPPKPLPRPVLPPPEPEPAPTTPRPTGRRSKSEMGWRDAQARSGIACRVCGTSLESGGSCRRCGESAPRPGDTPSSSIGRALPPAPPARRLVLLGALSCAAIGLPVTLFLEGEARQVALVFDLVVGALAGPWARRGAGLPAFTVAGAAASAAKVAIGTLLGSAALSWDALQADPLLLGLLGATLFATTVLGGLLGLSSAPVEGDAALEG